LSVFKAETRPEPDLAQIKIVPKWKLTPEPVIAKEVKVLTHRTRQASFKQHTVVTLEFERSLVEVPRLPATHMPRIEYVMPWEALPVATELIRPKILKHYRRIRLFEVEPRVERTASLEQNESFETPQPRREMVNFKIVPQREEIADVQTVQVLRTARVIRVPDCELYAVKPLLKRIEYLDTSVEMEPDLVEKVGVEQVRVRRHRVALTRNISSAPALPSVEAVPPVFVEQIVTKRPLRAPSFVNTEPANVPRIHRSYTRTVPRPLGYRPPPLPSQQVKIDSMLPSRMTLQPQIKAIFLPPQPPSSPTPETTSTDQEQEEQTECYTYSTHYY
jgi:hypothetical protein